MIVEISHQIIDDNFAGDAWDEFSSRFILYPQQNPMNEVLIPILFGWDDVNIGYMKQNIVGHMSTFFVCILFISYMDMPSFRTFPYLH